MLPVYQEFNLSAAARTELEAFVVMHRKRIVNARSAQDLQALIQETSPALMPELFAELKKFRDGDYDILRIRGASLGLQGGYVPETPSSEETVDRDQMARLLYKPTMMLLYGLSHMVRGERAFKHIIPSQTHQDLLVSSHKLSAHGDMIWAPKMPETSSLCCLRGDEDAETFFISNEEIISHLDDETKQILSTRSFELEGHPFEHPVLCDNGQIRYLKVLKGMTDEADAALEKLDEAIQKSKRHSFALSEGDIVFFRNDRMLHGRLPAQVHGGDKKGQNRWAVRLVLNFVRPHP